ncbi:hypothetical protein [Vibrio sp. AND4]|uniref:hypothetical protein n=1 Tax=Vibrio sp. AND4 TaxID=314289 RepID=UPI00015F3569|nr:hypothetical protein [Vibrio sp. AND4]EDP59775.1 hypothetical protein AND4_11474 [Vibrio sp. AND4]
MLRIIILSLSLTIFSTYAAEITVHGKIKWINNWQGHSGFLVALEDMSRTSGICKRNDQYILPQNHQFAKENFSMLLSSRIADKPVTLVLRSGDCLEGFIKIAHIRI